ncbi:MAG: hypothetical protein Tsb009_02400 [Planctomycetaceae bacterium]
MLKAHDLRALGSKVAFNFEDLRQSCDAHIEQTQKHAKEIIEKARQEADSIRQNAREQGQREGLEWGLKNAEEEIHKKSLELAEKRTAEELANVLPALKDAANTLAAERDRWITDWESSAIRLCVAIAEKILQQKLELKPELRSELILDAVRQVAGNPQIRLRLNPADLEQLGDHAEEVIASVASCGKVSLIGDDSISAGGSVIETEFGVLDARLETQLERIASELIQQDL